MNKFYSYGKQTIEQDDIDAVVEALKSDWLTQGPYVEKFEKNLANKFGAQYVTALSNGTAGLHLIGLALGWQKGDVVITTPITFLASANCILYCGATPDFVDIDPVSYTIDVAKLEEKILDYRSKKINIRAVIAVDYAGQPCDWLKLRKLADRYDFQLVNDNCHALGAEFNGDFQYAAKFADAVNMSFHPVKHITTGEGGAVLTNNSELAEKIKILRTHGMTKDPKLLSKNDGPWYYEMHALGFNYRITDFQCALGITQLKKLDSFVNRRNKIASLYNDIFGSDEKFVVPSVSHNNRHSYHLYPLLINFPELKISRKEYFQKLKENGINLQVHYFPVQLQPYYKNHFGFKEGEYPNAEDFYRKEVSIPMYPGLEASDINIISDKLKKFAE